MVDSMNTATAVTVSMVNNLKRTFRTSPSSACSARGFLVFLVSLLVQHPKAIIRESLRVVHHPIIHWQC